MSEATRARRQHTLNRLEELRAKYGHESSWPELAVGRAPPIEDGVELVAREAMDPPSYAHLALDDDMLRRSHAAPGIESDMPSEQPAQPEPSVERTPTPPTPPRRRRRKQVEEPIVDLGQI